MSGFFQHYLWGLSILFSCIYVTLSYYFQWTCKSIKFLMTTARGMWLAASRVGPCSAPHRRQPSNVSETDVRFAFNKQNMSQVVGWDATPLTTFQDSTTHTYAAAPLLAWGSKLWGSIARAMWPDTLGSLWELGAGSSACLIAREKPDLQL